MYSVLILGFLLVQGISSSEPQCSRFHYEEQTLLKMLKLELFVEKMKEDLQTTQQKVLETLQTIEHERGEFKLKYDELKRSNEADMARYDVARRPTIIFRSRDLANQSPASGETLVFKETMLNEGNGYDNSTGIFTAPVAGVYLLTIQFCIPNGQVAYYSILAENKEIKTGYFYDVSASGCYTADGIAVLKEQHRVWIKVQTFVKFLEDSLSTYIYWNSFSGVLLHT